MTQEMLDECALIAANTVWDTMDKMGVITAEIRAVRETVILMINAAAASGIQVGEEWCRRNPAATVN